MVINSSNTAAFFFSLFLLAFFPFSFRILDGRFGALLMGGCESAMGEGGRG
jgi:hypothetical protein